MRASVSQHFREQLRPSSPPKRPTTPKLLSVPKTLHSPPAIAQAFMYLAGTPGQYLQPEDFNENQQRRIMQQGQALGDSRRPQVDYGLALGELSCTVQHEYSRPGKSISDHAHRQVHQAEYGRPPPIIHPPKPESLFDPGLETVSLPMPSPIKEHMGASPPGQIETRARQAARQRLRSQQQQIRQSMRRSSKESIQEYFPTTHEEAEIWAFSVAWRTGLNAFHAPKGYMPANVVDQFEAWDEDGKMLWVLVREKRVQHIVEEDQRQQEAIGWC